MSEFILVIACATGGAFSYAFASYPTRDACEAVAMESRELDPNVKGGEYQHFEWCVELPGSEVSDE